MAASSDLLHLHVGFQLTLFPYLCLFFTQTLVSMFNPVIHLVISVLVRTTMHRCVLSGILLLRQGLLRQGPQLQVSRWVFVSLQSACTFLSYGFWRCFHYFVHNSRISMVPHLANFLVLAVPPTARPPPSPTNPPPTNIQFSGELGGEIEWYRGTVQGGKKIRHPSMSKCCRRLDRCEQRWPTSFDLGV